MAGFKAELRRGEVAKAMGFGPGGRAQVEVVLEGRCPPTTSVTMVICRMRKRCMELVREEVGLLNGGEP